MAFLLSKNMDILPSLTPFLIYGTLLTLYVLPGLVAYWRQNKNWPAITFLTVVTGWTVLFWIVCMTWALMSQREKNG